MKTIRVKCEIQKKQGIVLLEFDFDLEIKELVKVIPHSTWNHSLKAWTLPYKEGILEKLLAHFQGKAWLDYSKFRKISSDHLLPSLPVLNGYLEGEIKKFREWMQNRRYAESTVKTYCQSLSLFFRFLENKNPEEINSEDLENFHQNYVLRRKYSVSFQSQVINVVKLYFSNRQKRSLDPIEIERPKKPRLLPHVLSKEEVKSILLSPKNLKHRTMLSLIYACGLRRNELLNLKINDVDSNRGLLRITVPRGLKTGWYPLVRRQLKC